MVQKTDNLKAVLCEFDTLHIDVVMATVIQYIVQLNVILKYLLKATFDSVANITSCYFILVLIS